MRYVEANALRAGMVERAQAWPWSSLGKGDDGQGGRVSLSPWPVDRPNRWADKVNDLLDKNMIKRIHLSIARNRPFGDDPWVRRTARRYNLETTLRDPWRPKKIKESKSKKKVR
jgi:putative transposase